MPTKIRNYISTYALLYFCAAVAMSSLAACGGGDASFSPVAQAASSAPVAAPAPVSAPALSPAAPIVNPDLVSSVQPATYAAGSTEKGAYDTLNAARSTCGFGLLQQDIRLDVASFNHAHYLAQNSLIKNLQIIGHFEDPTYQFFTGNSPADRALFAGFPSPVTENYTSNASYQPLALPVQYVATEALGAGKMHELIESVYHGRASLSAGRSVGFGSEIAFGPTNQTGYNQSQLRLVNEISAETNTQKLGSGAVASFPCQGATVTGVFYPAIESPNPFPSVTSATVAYGTPLYFKADAGATLVVTTGTLTKVSDNSAVNMAQINSTNDVTTNSRDRVTANEAFLVPTSALTKGAIYAAHVVGTVNGTAFQRDFTFSTAP